VHLHDAIREWRDGTKVKPLVSMPGRDQRDALADEYGHDADDELIDRVFVQERRDEIASAHHPDVLALLVPQTFREGVTA
jgi:hypothetical protein